MTITQINRRRGKYLTKHVASVDAVWQKKGPTYAIVHMRFHADGKVAGLPDQEGQDDE